MVALSVETLIHLGVNPLSGSDHTEKALSFVFVMRDFLYKFVYTKIVFNNLSRIRNSNLNIAYK